MIFCMEMRNALVSGKILRWYFARTKKPAPTHFTGFYPATYPDDWNKEKERDNNDLVDEIKPGEEEE